jgi:ribosome-associated heat shock protein Hsp15
MFEAGASSSAELLLDDVIESAIQVQTGEAPRPKKKAGKFAYQLEAVNSDCNLAEVIAGLSAQRGPAPVAQLLYQETADSIEQRAKLALQQRYAREPALSKEQGRPTKRDRRELEQARHGWDERWSASVDK